MPDAPEASAALGLALCNDGERRGAAGGELAGSLIIGAVDLVDQLQGKITGVFAAVGLDQRAAQAGWTGDEFVAAGTDGIEGEALLAEFFHVLPDGDAAHAEFFCERSARDVVGFAGEQFF